MDSVDIKIEKLLTEVEAMSEEAAASGDTSKLESLASKDKEIGDLIKLTEELRAKSEIEESKFQDIQKKIDDVN